jgi:hypothetical protein
MKREAGFYWVKWGAYWTVAEFTPFYDEDGTDYGSWYICGNECMFMTREFEEIADNPLVIPGKIPERTTIKSIVYQSGLNYAITLEKENSNRIREVFNSFFNRKRHGR